MKVETHLDPNMGVYQAYPSMCKGDKGVRGVIPHRITLMCRLFEMEEMDQVTQ